MTNFFSDLFTRKILLLILAALTALVGFGSYLQTTIETHKKAELNYFQEKQRYEQAEKNNPVQISK